MTIDYCGERIADNNYQSNCCGKVRKPNFVILIDTFRSLNWDKENAYVLFSTFSACYIVIKVYVQYCVPASGKLHFYFLSQFQFPLDSNHMTVQLYCCYLCRISYTTITLFSVVVKSEYSYHCHYKAFRYKTLKWRAIQWNVSL